jgi:hypothetical protein
VTFEQAIELFGARRNGGSWMARCPAHEDSSPSLSIREGDDGRVLLHCFAGCPTESICSALGIKLSDLFAGPGTFTPKPQIVRDAERAITDLRHRLTPRERVREVTVVYTEQQHADAGIARALALAAEGEIVQLLFTRHP